MSQKWIDCSNTTNALRMVPTHPSCHLSDGTLVFIDFDGAYWYLKWWGHTGSPTTIFTFLGWGGASFSICRDSSNNIYVGSANFAGGTYYSTLAAFPYTGSHTWNTSITECSYAYGGGYVSTGCNALMWVNDGGGVGGAGHILWVASAYNSSTSSSELLGLVFDAGAALVGTTTVTTNTSLMGFDSSAWGICDACASFGIGSTSGIWGYGDTNSGGVVFGTWSINSSGILTKTYVGTIPASVGHISCVSQSPGNYTFLTCVSGSGYYGATCVTATTKSSTVSSGAVANMPQNMDYLSYIACNMFLDPLTANQVWVIAPGTLSGTSIPIYRLSIATGSGTPVWNTTAVLDDTFTGVYAQPYVDISVVREPVGTMVDYACDADPASGTYALFGDYVAFASAPSPPTLSTPINGQSVDVSVTGVTVGGYYNSTDMQNMNAYALQIKTSSGSWQYYNASGGSLQSTIVWNTLVTQIVPGGFFQVSLSPTLVSDGNVYNWSFASQEACLNLQGSFATPFTFTGMTAPIVSVTSPTGVVSHGQPTVTWTESLPSGSIQTGYEIVICTAVGAGAPGGTIISDSGVINSTALSAQPAPLSASGTYYAYVQVTETGGETGAWAYSAFTFLVDSPGLPTYTVVQGTDSNGVPCFIHTIQGHDNIMDQASSSLETGLGNWQCALNNTVGFGGPVNGFDSSANASHIVTEAGVVVGYSAGIGLQPCLGNLDVSGADSSSYGMNLVLTGAAPTSIASNVGTAFFQAAQLSASTYTIAGPAGAGWTNGAITSIASFTAECTYTPSAADVASGSTAWIIGRAGEWGFEFTGSGNVNVYVYNSVGTAVQVGSLGTLVAGTTYNIALCQSSTTWYTFLNGVLKSTYTTALTVKTPSAGTSFAIGGTFTSVGGDIGAYTANYSANTVTKINLSTFATVGSDLAVGTNPHNIAIDPTGTYAYVVNYGASTVTKINLSTFATVGSALAVGTNPYNIAIDPTGTYAYVANYGASTVTKINLSTFLTVGSALAVGTNPYSIAIDSTGTYAYTANYGASTVTKINLSTFLTVGSALTVGSGPCSIAIDPTGTYAYTANFTANTVTKINLSTFVTVGSALAVGTGPFDIAIDSTGTYAYTANSGASTVTKINLSTFATVGSALAVGTNPYSIAIDSTGTYAYTANFTANTVTKINLSTFLTVGSALAVGSGPFGIALALGSGGMSTGLSGVIDEVRISDVCRYTSGYTPATTPFANDVNTGCLYHLDFAAPAANFGETMYQSTSGNTSGPSGNNAGQGAILGTAWSVEVQISGTGSGIVQRTGSNSHGVQWSLQYNSGSLTLNFVNSAGTLLSVSGTLVPSQVSVVQGSWDGSNIRLFVNGILQGTTACTSVWPATGSGYNLAMDNISGTVTIDELRVSNIARNVANYIPQTTEYVVDSNTCVLYHFDGGIVQSSSESVDDSYSLYIISGPNGGYAIWQSYASQVIAPSSAYTIQAEFYEPGSTPAQVTVNWLTSSGAVISSADSTCTSTVGWVPCTFNASSPSTAYGVSIALEAPSGAVGALIDVIGISPGTSQPWVLGGFAGSEVCSILRSDGLYVRGAGYTTSVPVAPDWVSTVSGGNCLPLSSPGQLAVLNDYESVPGIAYTFSAQLMGTGGLYTPLVSAGPITLVIPNTMWFFIDPTNPSLSLQAAVTSQTTSQYKLTGANYPLSDSATAVMPNVTSLGTYGQSGTLVTQTGSPAEWLALKTLLSNPDIKFLINPFSEGIYCTLAVADPTGGTSGAVHSTTFKGGSNVAPYRESTITYTQVGRP